MLLRISDIFFVLLLGVAAVAALARPASAKTGRTYYSEDQVAAIRQRASEASYARELAAILDKASRLAGMSDEEIWALIPDASMKRALNVCFGVGCPVHGAQVFKAGGHYPWITSPDKPFQVQCPVGKEVYPSNDFAAYLKSGGKEKLDTTRPYVDDGSGYVAPDGKRYWFVGYYAFWELWRHTIIDGIDACASSYILTGDPKYAHVCAVALARISQVYPKMNYRTQAYHNGKWPSGINGRILDYIWENSVVITFAAAYDAIFPTFQTDQSLINFAASKGVPDVRSAIETNILQTQVQDIFQKKIWGNKFELGSLSSAALALDNTDPAKGATTQQMIDWMLKGDGELEFTFYNGFDRDGMGGESSPSYSSIWNSRMVAAAENLAMLGVDLVKDPKWVQICRGPSQLRVLDALSPRLGDCGGDIKGAPRIIQRDVLEFGASHLHDPYCAALLLKSGLQRPALMDRTPTGAQTLKETAKAGPRFPNAPYTRNLGGYGLAILELNDGKMKRSATMYYGATGASHGHRDRLTMSYHLDGRDALTELGYPSHWGPRADFWIKNTPSHYCVMIDGQAQDALNAGNLIRFVDLPGLKLAEAEAPQVWKSTVKDYRRMLALLDTGEESALLIDAFFVEAGRTRDYSFHGLPFGAFSVDAPILKEQDGGSVAGPDILPDTEDKPLRSGYQYLTSPRWYQPEPTMRFDWKADCGLNMAAWFPRLSFDEVIVADGKPPVKPGYPDNVPYILLRGHGRQPALYLAVVDVEKGGLAVQSVQKITSDTPKAGGCVVRLKSGSTWRIYVNGSGARATYVDGASMDAAFGAVPEQTGKKGYIAGAGTLTMDGRNLAGNRACPEAVVEKVDYAAGEVWLKGWAPKSSDVIIVRNGPASASYTVTGVQKDGDLSKISFGAIPIITGRYIAAWDASQKLIVSSERLGGTYNQFAAKDYTGMFALSEDFRHTSPITGFDKTRNTLAVAGDSAPALFADHNSDGHSFVYISDFGPGAVVTKTPASTFKSVLKAR